MIVGALDILVRFSRLASEASSAEEILPLLADAAIDHLKADAAAVVVVDGGGAHVAASRGAPAPIAKWSGAFDDLGELGHDLLAASPGTFARVLTLPLVSRGRLFGALVLLHAAKHELDEEHLSAGFRHQIAVALADLAAVALGQADQIGTLTRANAELRASRETLARTEKLRSLGQMAAGVSHDLKNILNPLSMHAQLAERALAKGKNEEVVQSLHECRSIIQRGVETLERLRAFSRQSPEALAKAVDLRALLHEAAAIARPRMSSGKGRLSRIVEVAGDPVPAIARADEVVAAAVNLVVNAIDAMPDGGTITLSAGLEAEGPYLRVADDGPGMPPEVQARVFEPFFTTKGTEGTGLGLAMVFATMQRQGGHVTLETSPGHGATFTLWFASLPS